MKNSSTICQIFIGHVLKRFSKIPGLDIIHYIDVLLDHYDRVVLDPLILQVLVVLEAIHLKVKVQLTPPYEFLGSILETRCQ